MSKNVQRVVLVFGVGGGLVFAALVLVLALPFTGAPQLWHLEDYVEPASAAEKAALVQAQIQASAVLVQILGGILLIGTIYTALHTVRQAQQSLELSREQLRITQEGQITERFTKAIEQLGAINDNGRPRLEVRLGGIYALERIARDSPRDHWPIMEVLTAYIREHVSEAPPLDETPIIGVGPSTDVQAILTVIGRRSECQRESETERLNLARKDLAEVNLSGAYLERVSLSEANLTGAVLRNAVLRDATLAFTNFTGADLENADLTQAYLGGATMRARLKGSVLRDAELIGTDLTDADLTGANLTGANLTGANLTDTNLIGADLTGAQGLSQDDIDLTYMDEKTRLPEAPTPDGQPLRRSVRSVPESPF